MGVPFLLVASVLYVGNLSFNSLLAELKQVVLFRDKSDGWEWKFDKTKQYSVKSAYYSITTSSMEPNFSTYPYQLLWKSKAPLKVLSFAWRLFQDRILPRMLS
ncbi:hypothetical protein Lal_00026280 [Lupinus albus]|nr:hypothetical protein Lal_00026280 [Lupinus albus]